MPSISFTRPLDPSHYPMTDQHRHPITPPPELVEDWAKRFIGPNGLVSIRELVAQAARWGR
jgi:hypothetical protein